MTLDAALMLAGTIGQTAVLGVLLYRRALKTLPFFCVYNAWTVLGNLAAYLVQRFLPSAYYHLYLIEESVDFLLQYCVLVEVAWSVFKPFRASLPRATPYILGALMAVLGAIVWPFADSASFSQFGPQGHLLARLEQTDSILRIVFFLVLAGCSQILTIGWKDRELQVATGLGFYSLVALGVSVIQSHQADITIYHRLDQVVIGSYLCSLGYWAFSFLQKEVARREFSPQMQSMLLAVAGAARATRIGLEEKSRKQEDSIHSRKS